MADRHQPDPIDDDGPRTIAALDLGSNSFHLIVASLADGHLQVVDRIRDMVQLATAIDDDLNLIPERTQPALDALARYRERLNNLPSANVRAVGTNTLRKAHNARWFLGAAHANLGHPVEVISGREEARLIYMGVAHALGHSEARRLVVDIGGGSTEFALGRRATPEKGDSLFMGCVDMTRQFMADGKLTPKRFGHMRLAALNELSPIQRGYAADQWDVAFGSSGTARAILRVCHSLGLADDRLTPQALHGLRDHILAPGHRMRVDLPGVTGHRRTVLPAGLAILTAVFEALGIESMEVSPGALREGLLHELVGRMEQMDVRERAVRHTQTHYQVDLEQAQRVRKVATALATELQDCWDFDPALHLPLLGWAADLHEIGLSIAHSQFHKHGAYLLRNMDLPGFSQMEQARLAALVRVHRRKFAPSEFAPFARAEAERLQRLAVVLRLAALLHRARGNDTMPPVHATADGCQVQLSFPVGWLGEHPLTALGLRQEREFLRAAQFDLVIREGRP